MPAWKLLSTICRQKVATECSSQAEGPLQLKQLCKQRHPGRAGSFARATQALHLPTGWQLTRKQLALPASHIRCAMLAHLQCPAPAATLLSAAAAGTRDLQAGRTDRLVSF